MAQLDKLFTAYFSDTSTAPGTPLTGLSATIIIREVDTGLLVINDEAMIEIGGGWYKYTFSDMSNVKDYVYSCDPNSASAYIESGVTDKRMNNIDSAISDIRASGGGGGVNYGTIQEYFNKLKKDVMKKLEEMDGKTTDEVSSIISNIENIPKVSLDVVVDKISSSESKIDNVLSVVSKAADLANKEKEKKMKMEIELLKKTIDDMEDVYEEEKQMFEETMKEEMDRHMKEKEEIDKNMKEEIKNKEKEKESIYEDANEVLSLLEEANKEDANNMLEKIKSILIK